MYEAMLARVRLFQDLSRRDLTWLSEGCREREYPAGTVLVRAGQWSGSLFILLSGSVAMILCQDDGSERPIGQFGAGAVFGEMALCGPATQRETITALVPCAALVLPHWDFQATLRESPDIAIKLLSTISGWLIQAERRAPRITHDIYDPHDPRDPHDSRPIHDTQEAD
jgi:CRP/FNR family cyclic AMP-dependent transcriptional regulator